jgi:two-component system sensor histidine kinase GlrK
MKIRGPQSLNGLILVGFGLVALPLLIAVIWALVNLDRLAEQSEQLVISGVSAAENNRQLAEQVGSLERVARQFVILRNEDSITLVKDDMNALQATLNDMSALTEQAQATTNARAILVGARRIVRTLSREDLTDADAEAAIAEFSTLRQ